MKTIVFFITVLLNALSTGFFFAWSVSVILGTKKVGHLTYLETMQSINREILNPLFFIVFFGNLIALGITTYLQFNNKTVFVLVLAFYFPFNIFCSSAVEPTNNAFVTFFGAVFGTSLSFFILD